VVVVEVPIFLLSLSSLLLWILFFWYPMVL
jgi:hypothetical protein